MILGRLPTSIIVSLVLESVVHKLGVKIRARPSSYSCCKLNARVSNITEVMKYWTHSVECLSVHKGIVSSQIE